MKKHYKSILSMAIFAIGSMTFAQGDIPNAEVGKCYAKCVIPAEYTTEQVTIQVKAASTKITSTPAVYETRTEKVLVKAASTKITTIPAVYSTATEKVLVKEPGTRLVAIPATYRTETEKVIDKEASTSISTTIAVYRTETEKVQVAPEKSKWVKSTAPGCLSQNPDDCIVWCLKTVPAQFKTVTKRVLVTPAASKVTNIPATYKTITKQVVAQPARTETKIIPAEYKTITKRVLATPATSKSIDIPAVYKSVTKRVLVTPAATKTVDVPGETRNISKQVLAKKGGHTEWKEVICDADLNQAKIRQIQLALIAKGYSVGPRGADNILGKDTRAALLKYQKANNLPQGNLNKVTLRHLGVE